MDACAEYIRQVSCYHTVLESEDDVDMPSLRHCNRYWQARVKPSLRHVTAHRFYCDVTGNATIAVRRWDSRNAMDNRGRVTALALNGCRNVGYTACFVMHAVETLGDCWSDSFF